MGATADDVTGGLVAADQEQHRLVEDLGIGEALAVDLRLHEHADQVVGGGLAPSSHDGGGVLEVAGRRQHLGLQQLRVVRSQGAHEVVAPVQELLPIGGRDAQQVADGDERQPRSHVPHQVELPALGGRVQERSGGAADRVLLVANPTRCEPLVDELAPLEVLRVVGVDHARHRGLVGSDPLGVAEALRLSLNRPHEVIG